MIDQPSTLPPDCRVGVTFVVTDQSRQLVLGTKPAPDETRPPAGRYPLPSIPSRIAVPFMATVVAAMTLVALLALFAIQPEPIPTTEIAPAALDADHSQPANPGPVY